MHIVPCSLFCQKIVEQVYWPWILHRDFFIDNVCYLLYSTLQSIKVNASSNSLVWFKNTINIQNNLKNSRNYNAIRYRLHSDAAWSRLLILTPGTSTFPKAASISASLKPFFLKKAFFLSALWPITLGFIRNLAASSTWNYNKMAYTVILLLLMNIICILTCLK